MLSHYYVYPLIFRKTKIKVGEMVVISFCKNPRTHGYYQISVGETQLPGLQGLIVLKNLAEKNHR